MVIPSRLLEYVVAAMVIIFIPGPSVLFIIARAVAWGRKIAVFTVVGNVTGAFTLSAVVAIGLAPLLQSSRLIYQGVQFAGGSYLIYLGIDAIRHRQLVSTGITNQVEKSPGLFRSMREGFWVGALNPKGVVFFAAVLPSFIDRDRGYITLQLLFLGAIFAAIAFFSDSAWALLAGTAREWLATDTKRIEILRAVGGIVMFILGLLVIVAAIVSTK